MNQDVSPELRSKLESISWFAHAGEPEDRRLSGLDPAYLDRKGMLLSHGSLKWQRALNQAGNRMSEYLYKEHHGRYLGEWNAVALAAGAYFDALLLDAFFGFRETFELSQAFIVWNRAAVIDIVIADHYRDLGVDAAFPDMVLASYEAGRYPCGWAGGEWPEGRLLVW